jgi:hypothetical protein
VILQITIIRQYQCVTYIPGSLYNKGTPPNDFPLGLIRSHMVVIFLFLMLYDLQRVVRDLLTTLYITKHMYTKVKTTPSQKGNVYSLFHSLLVFTSHHFLFFHYTSHISLHSTSLISLHFPYFTSTSLISLHYPYFTSPYV